ncbi:hypothetical protein [Natronomonas sp. EA1]|uniref:hypothetical protein n=1 Tax=Natronomonas sp. EA1 TaxID=3421655 RepID=UPI003EC0973D
MSEPVEAPDETAAIPRPDWDDAYLDRVADRLVTNYDLERDHREGGERFDLFGRLYMESQKQFLHPSVNFANHHQQEYLYARRTDGVSVAEIDRLVDLADDLAAKYVEADEEHYGTDFTFVLVVPEVPEDVRERVASLNERTLIKYGYHGHYEVNVAVVAPEAEEAVRSHGADVAQAFVLWERLPDPAPGLLKRLLGRIRG